MLLFCVRRDCFPGEHSLTYISLPQVLLSRFIINLRRSSTPGLNLSDNSHLSRISIPNLRILTIDDIVDNLGEPLDFVEYRIGDEDVEGLDAANTDEQLAGGSDSADVHIVNVSRIGEVRS